MTPRESSPERAHEAKFPEHEIREYLATAQFEEHSELDVVMHFVPNWFAFEFAQRRGMEDGFLGNDRSQIGGHGRRYIELYDEGVELGRGIRKSLSG